jgi:hypothetical protein
MNEAATLWGLNPIWVGWLAAAVVLGLWNSRKGE